MGLGEKSWQDFGREPAGRALLPATRHVGYEMEAGGKSGARLNLFSPGGGS